MTQQTLREEFEKEEIIHNFCGNKIEKCTCENARVSMADTKEIAYSLDINIIRPILAKYQNEWKNGMLVELADELSHAREEVRNKDMEGVAYENGVMEGQKIALARFKEFAEKELIGEDEETNIGEATLDELKNDDQAVEFFIKKVTRNALRNEQRKLSDAFFK